MAADEPMDTSPSTEATENDVTEERKESNINSSNSINSPGETSGTQDSNVVNDTDLVEAVIKFIPRDAEIVNFVLTAVNDIDDDENEEEVYLTPDEVRTLLKEKVTEYVSNKDVNPLLIDENKCKELLEHLMQNDLEQLVALNRMFDNIGKDRDKFLRKNGMLVKNSTSTIGVSIDLPILPNSISALNNLPVTQVVNSSDSASSSQKPSSGTVPVKTDKTGKTPKTSPENIECIDLTDDNDPPKESSSQLAITLVKHPAPLPLRPNYPPNAKLLAVPPKPRVNISTNSKGIVLQWDMPPNTKENGYAPISSFEVFGYQEQRDVTINTLLWKKIGSVRSMHLPMACTLTQFLEGHRYHFSIRGVDLCGRFGFYSDPISITYKIDKKNKT